MKNTVGNILKVWRNQHRYSQLQLALELGVSSKHISFIETGRSIPSKEMILKISTFLLIPKSEINRALYSAGYAPIFTELTLSDKSLKPILEAIEKMVTSHMPYPAFVLNQSWDVIVANKSAQSLLTNIGYSEHTNLLEALITDNPETSKIINYYETISFALTRVKQEISMLGNSKRLQEYEKKLSKCLSPKVEVPVASEQVVLSTQFQLSGVVLTFFSVIAQLGTVQDVTVSEYKVELMFPSNEATKEHYF